MASKQAEENQRLLQAYREETDPRKKSRLEGKIVEQNMPFVKMKVRKFLARTYVAVDPEDAVQVGAIGLLTAIRKDRSKSAFTTYANWWVFHELQSLASKTQQIHRPKGAGMPYKSFRVAEAIKAATNEDATDEQLGLKKGAVEEWRQSPVFFPLDDTDENESRKSTQEKMASEVRPADEILLELEEDGLLSAALDALTPEQRAELEHVFLEGKKVRDVELLESTLDLLYVFMETNGLR